MCLTPLKILNRTSFVYQDDRQKLFMDVPCGHCAECFHSKTMEWLVRLEYEFKETFDRGGVVLFDTLTYNNYHLPTIGKMLLVNDVDLPSYVEDMSCFNYYDIRYFLVRFRTNLSRKGYNDVRNNMSYYIVSEYGMSPGSTYRPHYHLLLFIKTNVSDIDLINVSDIINTSWSLGRTDGVSVNGPYKFMKEKVLRKGTVTGALSNYLAGYVVKDITFGEQFQKRYAILKHCIDNDLLDEVVSYIKPFHRQSQKFGLYALIVNDINRMLYTNCVSSGTVTSVLPTYYVRHLLQYRVRFTDGTYHWYYHDNSYVRTYFENKENNKFYASTLYYNNILINSDNEFITKVSDYLNGRSLDEFINYVNNYKDRIFFDSDLSVLASNSSKYNLPNDTCFISSSTAKSFEKYSFKGILLNDKVFSFGEFKLKYCVSENSDPCFKNFDKLYELFKEQYFNLNSSKNEVYHLKNKYRKLRSYSKYYS